MLILKIIGAVMILLSGYMFGRHIHDNLHNRVKVIEYIRKSLEYIDNKITIENAYLEDAVRQCIDEIYAKEEIAEPFSCFISNIRENNMSTQDSWDNACDILYDKCDYIKIDEKNYISQIGGVLALADKERQSEGTGRIICGLNEVGKQACDKAKKDGGLALKISMILAVMLIVLII